VIYGVLKKYKRKEYKKGNKKKEMKKKITHSQTKQIINNEGEILETEIVQTFQVDKEPDFIKMYIADINRLNNLPKGMDVILLALLKTMSYTNIIPVYMPIKQVIAREIGVSIVYLNKAIEAFYKTGIFIRVARGIYMADPELFAKGSWNDIKKLRLVIDYNKNGTKSLKSNLPEEMQLKLGFPTDE